MCQASLKSLAVKAEGDCGGTQRDEVTDANPGDHAPRGDLPATQVYEIMSPKVMTASPDDCLGPVARKMIDARYHRVIVTDPDNKVVGIVSSLDILHLLA